MADVAIHCKTIAWEAMKQATKSLEIANEKMKDALDANKIAQTYLKPEPPPTEEEVENVPPTVLPTLAPLPPPPHPVLFQFFWNTLMTSS